MSKAHPEHNLQIKCHAIARDFIIVPHLFLAFDRSRAFGPFSHEYERRRGIKGGTPDTLLRVQSLPNIWCEMKAPGNKPTTSQEMIGQMLEGLGDHWFWAASVIGYVNKLNNYGVPMMGGVFTAALIADAALSRSAGESKKPARSGPPRVRTSARKAQAWGVQRRATLP